MTRRWDESKHPRGRWGRWTKRSVALTDGIIERVPAALNGGYDAMAESSAQLSKVATRGSRWLRRAHIYVMGASWVSRTLAWVGVISLAGSIYLWLG